MIIKKYLDFLRESHEEFDSFGEWVVSLSDDSYIMNIVNRYINDNEKIYGGKDINVDIDLDNAINLLDDSVKMDDLSRRFSSFLSFS